MMEKMEKECQSESGLNDADISEAKKGNFGNNMDKLKIHALCFGKKIQFASDDGEMLIDNIKKFSYDHFDQKLADQIMSECVQKKATPEDTAFDMATCMFTLAHV